MNEKQVIVPDPALPGTVLPMDLVIVFHWKAEVDGPSERIRGAINATRIVSGVFGKLMQDDNSKELPMSKYLAIVLVAESSREAEYESAILNEQEELESYFAQVDFHIDQSGKNIF